jgi:hypothetical protein
MGYVVPDWKQSIKQNVYPITIGSKVYDLPKSKFLTGEQAEKFKDAGEAGASAYDLFNELTPGLGDALRKLPVGIFQEIITDWQADGGITLGESGASENS